MASVGKADELVRLLRSGDMVGFDAHARAVISEGRRHVLDAALEYCPEPDRAALHDTFEAVACQIGAERESDGHAAQVGLFVVPLIMDPRRIGDFDPDYVAQRMAEHDVVPASAQVGMAASLASSDDLAALSAFEWRDLLKRTVAGDAPVFSGKDGADARKGDSVLRFAVGFMVESVDEAVGPRFELPGETLKNWTDACLRHPAIHVAMKPGFPTPCLMEGVLTYDLQALYDAFHKAEFAAGPETGSLFAHWMEKPDGAIHVQIATERLGMLDAMDVRKEAVLFDHETVAEYLNLWAVCVVKHETADTLPSSKRRGRIN